MSHTKCQKHLDLGNFLDKIFFNPSQIRVETPYIPTFRIGGLDWWIALRWNHPFPVLCPRRVLPSPMESANKAPGTDSVCHNTNRHALSPKLYMKNGQPRGAKLIQIHESEVAKGVRNHWFIESSTIDIWQTNKLLWWIHHCPSWEPYPSVQLLATWANYSPPFGDFLGPQLMREQLWNFMRVQLYKNIISEYTMLDKWLYDYLSCFPA